MSSVNPSPGSEPGQLNAIGLVLIIRWPALRVGVMKLLPLVKARPAVDTSEMSSTFVHYIPIMPLRWAIME